MKFILALIAAWYFLFIKHNLLAAFKFLHHIRLLYSILFYFSLYNDHLLVDGLETTYHSLLINY